MIEFPLAAPSANPFKRISPTLPEHVHKAFGSKLPYILDGGKTKIGLESSILSFTSPEPLLLRHGAISLEELEAVCGPIGIKTRQTSDPQSPGQLQQHYSPGKPLYLVEDLETSLKLYAGQKISVLLFGKNEPAADYVYHLSRKSDLREAASNLFECLHQADDDRSDLILVQTLPDEGLGRAINDRLSRASSKEE
jgi:L-threonylcarbamoyladenylate synthase